MAFFLSKEQILLFPTSILFDFRIFAAFTELSCADVNNISVSYTHLWLEKIENFNIPELQTYVNGIRIDINAVKNGIKLKYNNGLAEGSVNKIKVIKRIMYGRNSFRCV